jgi:hypothetical protein
LIRLSRSIDPEAAENGLMLFLEWRPFKTKQKNGDQHRLNEPTLDTSYN